MNEKWIIISIIITVIAILFAVYIGISSLPSPTYESYSMTVTDKDIYEYFLPAGKMLMYYENYHIDTDIGKYEINSKLDYRELEVGHVYNFTIFNRSCERDSIVDYKEI
jgi:hypothetical protein